MRLRYRCIPFAVLFTAMLLPSLAFACLWDHDTIKMERTRFPGALELITGKFLRHSPEFYKWRIENRLKRLETTPDDPALLDDLAVAYDKTGQHEKAIETAIKTEKLHPNRYETAANLATFYFHSGKLAEGLPHIERALKINPDAHFGREKYQKLFVEYMLLQRHGGPLELPLSELHFGTNPNEENPNPCDVRIDQTFAMFIHPKKSHSEPLTPELASEAVKGVLGMMKFGKHDSPALLEALGSLLTQVPAPVKDAKFLASRAYLKASYEVPDGPVRLAYRAMASNALSMKATEQSNMSQITLDMVEPEFRKELEEGRNWYGDLRERELSWIRDGKDPEAEFDKLYEFEPEVSGMDSIDPPSPEEKRRRFFARIVLGLIVTVLTLTGLAILIHLRKKNVG